MRKGFSITFALLVLMLSATVASAQNAPVKPVQTDPKLTVSPDSQKAPFGGSNGETFQVTPTMEDLQKMEQEPPAEQLESWYRQIWARIGSTFIDPKKLEDWANYEHSFDGKLNSRKDLDQAINVLMVRLSTPGTVYVSSERVKALEARKEQKIVEAGIQLRLMNNSSYVVDAIVAGSPASKSSIREGDVIKTSGTTDLQWKQVDAAADLLTGVEGSKLKLVIVRGGKPVDVELTLTATPDQKVDSKLLPNRIAYIRLPELSNEETVNAFIEALVKMNVEAAGRTQGIILDLRNNPGGDIELAKTVGSLFMSSGDFVKETNRRDRIGNKTTYSIMPFVRYTQLKLSKDEKELLAVAQRVPMLVLVNGSTANAAEILAGALQDNERAQVIGTSTRAQGYGYEEGKLPHGGILTVAVQEYFTPKGTVIAGRGIRPNISVAQPVDATGDVQYESAVSEINNILAKRSSQLADSKRIAAEPRPAQVGIEPYVLWGGAVALSMSLFAVLLAYVQRRKARSAKGTKRP